MKELLEAGVHFGHQTRRWDPRMKNYIFTERNGIHIIDLQKTIAQLQVIHNAIKENIKNGGILLFVGTKRQAQNSVVEEAERCGMPYVANRWLGGMMTNFTTIQKSIQRLNRLERMEVDGSFSLMTKKEVIRLNREKEKMLKNIGGIKDLVTLPDMIFIIDTKKEAIAVAEAMRMKIPIVAIVDSNCNPEGIQYPIPGNDDAIRAINLFCRLVANAVVEGQSEAGKMEIDEEGEIMSLEEEEERARKEREESAEEEGYVAVEDEDVLSDNEVQDEMGRARAAEKTATAEYPAAETGAASAGVGSVPEAEKPSADQSAVAQESSGGQETDQNESAQSESESTASKEQEKQA
jgi:small subunit ribosomal protein S2